MTSLGLLDLDDDVLHALLEVTADSHPPHWDFPESVHPHGWEPIYINDVPHYPRGHPGPHFCLGWIYLSHVSSRLRQLCLDAPSLWGRVVTHLPSISAMPTILARARDAPLYFSTPRSEWATTAHTHPSSYHKAYRAKVDFAIEHFSDRVIGIEMHSVASVDDADWGSVLSHEPLPHLRRLALYNPSAGPNSRICVNAPNLDTFELHGEAFPVFPHPLRALTKLEIILGSGSSLTLEDSATLLDILRGTPRLEQLVLCNIRISAGGPVNEELPALRPVQLSKLRSVEVEVYEPDGRPAFWSWIDAAPDVNLDLKMTKRVSNEQVVKIIHAATPQLRFHRYNRLTFYATLGLVTGSANLNICLGSAGPGLSEKVVIVFWNTDYNILDQAIPALMELLDFERIEVLTLPETHAFWDSAVLFDFLDRFRATTTLVLDIAEWKVANHFVLRLLLHNAIGFNRLQDLASPDPNYPLLLPALSRLEVTYPNKTDKTSQEDYVLRGQAFWDPIHSFLSARKHASHPVDVLKFSGTWPTDMAHYTVDKWGLAVAEIHVRKVIDGRR
ncbi:hypothetical protein PENSPDRAFT_752722 [Peniophora sp. CONT]|nr:hypothetical protein PENSPDRAFT_752722 [Peniophora sp. CONT]